jgi:hypothetical protein
MTNPNRATFSSEQRPDATAGRYWLPTIPYNLVDAVNRHAAATGSIRYAQLATHADYNGHMLSFTRTVHGYWTLTYFFGERCTLARGTVADCLRAAAEEYKRGAKGTVSVTPDLTTEEAAVATSLGFVPWSKEIEEAHLATWYSDLHKLVGEAAREEEHFGPGAMGILLQSKSARDYRTRRELAFSKRHLGDFKIFVSKHESGNDIVMVLVSNDKDRATCTINGETSLTGPKDAARKWFRQQAMKGYGKLREVTEEQLRALTSN